MPAFTEKDVKKIAKIIGADESAWEKDHFRLQVTNRPERRRLVLEIFPDAQLGAPRGSARLTTSKGAMVVVYTGNTHLQLHNCTGYVTSEELGEVTFVGEESGRLSGLVVEQKAACSLYANVNRQVISSDFTKLGVEVMLSGVALSLAEEILKSEK